MLDGDHLFVNSHVQVCKDGIDGISKLAWHKGANNDNKFISKSLVLYLVDKQKMCMWSHIFQGCRRSWTLVGISEGGRFHQNTATLIWSWRQAGDLSVRTSTELLNYNLYVPGFCMLLICSPFLHLAATSMCDQHEHDTEIILICYVATCRSRLDLFPSTKVNNINNNDIVPFFCVYSTGKSLYWAQWL